jgi:hypothetical protein
MRSLLPANRLRSLLSALVLGGAMLGMPALALAAPPAAAATDVGRLEAECARLRNDLERANADVAALKRNDRGVRNDYRLRQRMADAEALARKLTDAEAQLRAREGAPVAPRAPALAPPSAQPGDGPVELEAKADLLSDQARRLAVEADGLARTAGELRGRQTLRRRAYQLERDPFAGLDGSKRSLVFGGKSAATSGGKGTENNPKDPRTAGGSMDDSAGPTRGGGGNAPGNTSTGGGSPPPSNNGGASGAPMQTPTVGPTAPPAGDGKTGGALEATPPQPTSALSNQLRTLLDPSTLTEVQRLERTGKPITDPVALEKVAAALRQRAQALESQAKSLRVRARP